MRDLKSELEQMRKMIQTTFDDEIVQQQTNLAMHPRWWIFCCVSNSNVMMRALTLYSDYSYFIAKLVTLMILKSSIVLLLKDDLDAARLSQTSISKHFRIQATISFI